MDCQRLTDKIDSTYTIDTIATVGDNTRESNTNIVCQSNLCLDFERVIDILQSCFNS